MAQPDFEQERQNAANQGMPEDPITGFMGASAELHEAYTEWVAAGFSEGQAIYLAGCVMTGNPGKPPVG